MKIEQSRTLRCEYVRKVVDGYIAQQWWPPGHPNHDPAMLSNRRGNAVDPPDYRRVGDLFSLSRVPGMGDDVFFLRTERGNEQVKPGDMIVEKDGRKTVWDVDLFFSEHALVNAVPQPVPPPAAR